MHILYDEKTELNFSRLDSILVLLDLRQERLLPVPKQDAHVSSSTKQCIRNEYEDDCMSLTRGESTRLRLMHGPRTLPPPQHSFPPSMIAVSTVLYEDTSYDDFIRGDSFLAWWSSTIGGARLCFGLSWTRRLNVGGSGYGRSQGRVQNLRLAWRKVIP
jgi:hypothetical protein